MGYDCTGPNQSAFTDGYSAQNDRAAADGGSAFYSGWHHLPVCFRLQLSISRGTRIQVIDEHDAVSQKYVVFNGHSLTDEGMRRDLAATADKGVLLHFHKRPDLRFITYDAPVEIDQIRLEDLYPFAQNDIRSNWHGLDVGIYTERTH